jgi:hypothetical protein
MADMLLAGLQWLQSQTQAYASVAVTYNAAAGSVGLLATVGTSLLKIANPAGGVQIVRTERDYIFPADSLVINNVVVEPAEGYTIDELWPDGITRRYQILSPGGQEPPWRYSDPRRIQIRAHTKFLQVVG